MKNLYLSFLNLLIAKKRHAAAFAIFAAAMLPVKLFGQAPTISYSSPQTYSTYMAITPLTPTAGGVAAPGAYGTPVLLGSGLTFNVNGLAVDAAGNVYVNDQDGANGLIKKISADGSSTTTIGSGFLSQSANVAVDGAGNVYVADQASVWKIPASGSPVTYGTPVTISSFPRPFGIAVDAQGNIYVADLNAGVYKMANDGSNKIRIDNGISSPSAIALDGTGNVYAVSLNTLALYEIPADGSPQVQLASGFSFPRGLAVDAAGTIYVDDEGQNGIYAVPAGGGTPVAAVPGLTNLVGVAVDANYNLYGTLQGPGGISKFSPTGGYFISPALPKGLSLNNTTGVISGTPTKAAAPADYLVSAYNSSGGVSGTVNITVNANTNLSGFITSQGALSPSFAPGTISYSKSVSNAVTSINVTPTTVDADATVTVNGSTVVSGTASADIPLVAGPNTISTIVTGQDGTSTQTYTLTVTRAPSANAFLSALATNAGMVTPDFASTTTSYTLQVGSAVTSITITPTTADSTATVTVNGATVVSGTASASLPLNIGSNTVTTIVAAQDGSTTKKYTIKVNRLSNNAGLSAFAISNGTLSPVFAEHTGRYTTSVNNAITSITVTPTSVSSKAVITVNGATVASGTASASIPLNGGNNTITTVVTAQDGTTIQTYTLVVSRLSNNAGLSNLTISNGTLSPAFGQFTTNYTASVSNATTSIMLTPTSVNQKATIKVNGVTVASGTVSASIPLNVGSNTITAVVTSQDGSATKTYTINVGRQSNNASLSSLALSSGTLSPAFSNNTLSYTASVNYAVAFVNVTPTAVNGNATITVNGTTVPSGTALANIGLNVGSNAITTVVTSQDGSTNKTYTLTITRSAPATIATLDNMTVSVGTISPIFTSGNTQYKDTVSNATASVTITPTASDAYATITIGGNIVASGTASASIPLNIASNTINAVVTAQDGTTTRMYSLRVVRLSNNASLANLILSSGPLSPSFTGSTFSYTASVSNATTSVTVTPTVVNATAAVKVNGIAMPSGSTSGAIALSVGANAITTEVTAQNGTIKTYTITVTRATNMLNSLYLPGSSEQKPFVASLGQKVEANNILSTNGDGINDIWVVKNIAFYPDNSVTVYNKAGQVVFTKKGYANDWSGTYRGSALSEGTYYYLVDLGNGSKIKGFITVVGH